MANLYTKSGDLGTTSLAGGTRVAKCSKRVECCGNIDEANSVLGMAYAMTKNQYVKESIDMIQRQLFLLGAEVASEEGDFTKIEEVCIRESDIEMLEGIVDRCSLTTGPQTEFVIPGTSQVSAVLHLARTVIRRCERTVIAARKTEHMREMAGKYLNRLSDAVFALARLEETTSLKERGEKYRCWPSKR